MSVFVPSRRAFRHRPTDDRTDRRGDAARGFDESRTRARARTHARAHARDRTRVRDVVETWSSRRLERLVRVDAARDRRDARAAIERDVRCVREVRRATRRENARGEAVTARARGGGGGGGGVRWRRERTARRNEMNEIESHTIDDRHSRARGGGDAARLDAPIASDDRARARERVGVAFHRPTHPARVDESTRWVVCAIETRVARRSSRARRRRSRWIRWIRWIRVGRWRRWIAAAVSFR